MTYLADLPNAVCPRSPRRAAAALRVRPTLPELRVQLSKDLMRIRYTDGPTRGEVEALLAIETKVPVGVRYDVKRVFGPEVFGALLLLPGHAALPGWQRGRAAWDEMTRRNLDQEPIDQALMAQGLLARMVGAPAGARLGWHQYRWDVHMWTRLTEVGDEVLAAVMSAPSHTI
jgi:hypothetical protein